jgi:hypothetical protein
MNYHATTPFASILDLIAAMRKAGFDPDKGSGVDAAHPFMLADVSTLYDMTRIDKDNPKCKDFAGFIASITAEMDNDRPVIFSKSADTGRVGEYHVVVACRLTGDEIWYFDPGPGSL